MDVDRVEETNFLRLFRDILDFISGKANVKDIDIERAIHNIINSFHYSKGRQFSQVNLNKAENICGYLHRYAALHAGFARARMLNAISGCEILRDFLNLPESNVVSLGGGPGNDVIGLCSALQYERENSDLRNKLNFTVVDSIQRWSSCLNLAEFLIREDKFGHVSELFKSSEVNMSFIRVDLPGEPHTDTKYFKTLRDAHVVMMVKLLSILDWRQKKTLVQSLIAEMAPGALLVFIDSPFPEELFFDLEMIYCFDNEEDRYTFSESFYRFGHCNAAYSKGRIFVLRKPYPRSFILS